MNFGLAIFPNGIIERARGALSMGTSISSYQVNCISSAVDTFLGFSQFGEIELKDKEPETDLVKTAIQNILLQKDISVTDINTVSKIFASKKLRDKFSLWISKKPLELVSIKNTSNLEEKIIGDLMNNSVGSSQFKEWLKVSGPTKVESGNYPPLPYRNGALCITSFGLFHQDGRQLYKPSTPCFRKNISGLSHGTVSYEQVEYQTISFYNDIHRIQLLYSKDWAPILDREIIKKVFSSKNAMPLEKPNSPNNTGSEPSSPELSSAPAGSIVPEAVNPPQE